MEFLILLGLINVLTIIALIFWPKREAPDLDWKSCVRRREEEKKKRQDLRRKIVEDDEIFEDYYDDYYEWIAGLRYAHANPANVNYSESEEWHNSIMNVI